MHAHLRHQAWPAPDDPTSAARKGGWRGWCPALPWRVSRILARADATDELRGIWARLDVLADQADDGFPLEGTAVDELLRGLQARLVAIYQDEVAARDELRAILA